MNRFSYYITIHFIPSNTDYNSCRVYQTYPKRKCRETNKEIQDKEFIEFRIDCIISIYIPDIIPKCKPLIQEI